MTLTRKEFQKLTLDLVVNLKFDHRLNVKAAGKDFYLALLKRHPDLCLRLARAVGFNKFYFLMNLKAFSTHFFHRVFSMRMRPAFLVYRKINEFYPKKE